MLEVMLKTEIIRRKKSDRKEKEMKKREFFFSEMQSKRLHIWQPHLLVSRM